MMANNSLLEKIENAKALDFGTIFNQSLNLFKKVWVQGLIMRLLVMLLMLPFPLILLIPMNFMGLFDSGSFQNTDDLSVIFIVVLILFGIIFSFFAMVINFGMTASFYRICKLKDLEELGTVDYFYYLKKPYLGKVIELSLVTFGISLVATLLCVFPVVYVMVPIALMNAIFAFNPELSTSEIVVSGFKLGNKKWGLTFGLMLISTIIAGIVGLLMCCVGIYVTSSFSNLPIYFIYKESVGFDTKNKDEGHGKSYE